MFRITDSAVNQKKETSVVAPKKGGFGRIILWIIIIVGIAFVLYQLYE